MALYPGSEDEIRIPVRLLRDSVAQIFQACGMTENGADIVTASLVDADVRGIHSHGVLRIPDYTNKLLHEGVDAKGEASLVTDNGAVMVIEGGNNLGQVGMTFAMRKALERAAETGIAFAAIGNSNHAGTMEYYARMALAHDMIGICGTNALPTMAPWGGRDKIIGLNPIGIAIPGAREGDFVLDTAFGATAHGKIRVFAQKGAPIPADWAFDESGQPTTDALAALEGLIQPIGGHKGIGLGMAIGMLSSLLSGAGYGLETGNMVDGSTPGADGQFVVVLKIAAFQDPSLLKSRVDKILQEVRNSRPVDGVERLYVPGDIEAELSTRNQEVGIPLNDATLDDILAVGGKVGADLTELAQLITAARS